MASNPYDEIVSSIGTEAESGQNTKPLQNDFDSIVAEDNSVQSTKLKQSFFGAQQKDPDRHVKVLEMSQRLKLPVEIVDSNFEDLQVQQKTRKIDYDSIVQDSPSVAQWAQKPENAALAQQDFEKLGYIEKSLKILGRKRSEMDMTGELIKAGETGFAGLESSTALFGAAYGLGNIDEIAEYAAEANKRQQKLKEMAPSYSKEFDKAMEKESHDIARASDIFFRGVDEYRAGKQTDAIKHIMAGGALTVGESMDMLYQAFSRPRGLAYSVTENLANSVPALAAGLGMGVVGTATTGPVGGVVGFASGTFMGSAFTEIGSQLNESIRKRGYDITNKDDLIKAYSDPAVMAEVRGEAERKGLTTAAVDMLFSAFAGRLVSKAKGIKGTAKAAVAEVGIQAAGETISEAAGQAAREKDIRKVNIGEAIQEGITSLGQSIGDVAIGGMMQAERPVDGQPVVITKETETKAQEIVTEYENALDAMSKLQAMQDIGNSVKELKHTAQIPEKMKELISIATDSDETKTVYFQSSDWDDYWQGQGKSPSKAAEQIMGDGGKAYLEAKQNGATFAVPMSDYIANVATTEDFDQMLPIMRMESDGMTLGDASVIVKELPVKIKGLVDSAVAPKEGDELIEAESREVGANIVQQLKNTGMKETEARNYSKIYENTFKTLARRTGKSPKELFNQYGLRIGNIDEAVEGEPGKTFFQRPVALPNINELGFYSQVENEVMKMDFKDIPAKDLQGRIKNIPGIKQEELDFMGLNEWLETRDGKVSKQEVLDFIRANGLQVEQLVLGDMPKAEPRAGIDQESQWGQEPKFSEPEWIEPDDYTVNDIVSNNWDNELYEIEKGRNEYFNEKLDDALKEAQAEVDEQNAEAIEKAKKEAESKGEEFDEDDVELESVDEEEVKSELLTKYQEEWVESEEENVRSEDAGYGEYKVTEENSDEELIGHDDKDYWSWNPSRSYGRGRGTKEYTGNLEEAKIKWMQDLYDEEYLQAPVDKPRPNDIQFDEEHFAVDEDKLEVEKNKIKENKEKVAELKEKSVYEVSQRGSFRGEEYAAFDAERKALFDGLVEENVDKQIESLAYEQLRNDIDTELEYKIVNEQIEMYDSDFEGYLKGNQTEGWEFKYSYLDDNQRRTTDTLDIAAGVSFEDAKKQSINALADVGYVYGRIEEAKPDEQLQLTEQKTPEQVEREAAVERNKPTSAGRWKSYTIKGPQNYREMLLRLPQVGPDKFQARQHWGDIANIIAHVRLTDRTDSEGRRTLFVEELQSDWHQQGRERGYKSDISPEEKDKLESLYKEKIEIDEKISSIKKRKEELSTNIEKYFNEGYYLDIDVGSGRKIRAFLNSENRDASAYYDTGEILQDAITKENFLKLLEDQDLKELIDIHDKSDKKIEDLTEDIIKKNDQINEIESKQQDTVPEAPLKNTEAWSALAMKRIMRMAIEEGYQAIAWTPGSVHVERWGTDSISWVKKEGGDKGKDPADAWKVVEEENMFVVKDENGNTLFDFLTSKDQALDKIIEESKAWKEIHDGQHWLVGSVEQVGGNADGVNIEDMARERGELLERKGDRVTSKEELKNVIRETLHRERNDRSLDSLTDSIWKQMQEKDSGVKAPRKEGMEFFYDNLLPKKVMPAIVKKLDKSAKVTIGKIDIGTTNITPAGEPLGVWEITITDEMKLKAKEGTTLFQPSDQGPLGQIRFGQNRQFNIELAKNANKSTFIHETGHFFLEVLGDLAQAEGAAQEVKDDYNVLLNWLGVESRDQITVEHHEQLARGFEAYLMEGKAPTNELRRLFNKFKVWLLDVYKNLLALNVELSDEVRGVFDRMLATQEEIDISNQVMNRAPLFSDKPAGMTEDQWIQYQSALDVAMMEEREKLDSKAQQQYSQRKMAVWRSDYKRIEKNITEQLNSQPIYQALSVMQTGKNPDGTDFNGGSMRLDRASVEQIYGKEYVKTLPKGIFAKENGVHYEAAAAAFGYQTGDQMIQEMATTPPKDQLVKMLTTQQMAYIHPDMTIDGTLHEEGLKAIHSSERVGVIRLELAELLRLAPSATKAAIRSVARRVPSAKAIRQQAEKAIAGKAVKELKPYVFQRAEAKAAKEAGQLLAKGDIEGALEAKQTELLNHELYRAAVNAKEHVEKTLNKFKRIAKSDEKVSKTRDMDLVNAARAIMAEYGIGKSDKTADEYLAKTKEYNKDRYNAVIVLVHDATQQKGNYKEITFDNFVAMSDAVTAIWDLAKTANEIEVDGEKIQIEQVKGELTEQIGKITKEGNKEEFNRTKSKYEEFKMLLVSARAAATRTEHWIDSADLGNHKGPFRKYIWNPIHNAVTQYRLKKRDVITKYHSILEAIRPTLTNKPINAPELIGNNGKAFQFRNKLELLMAMLHSGNESNLDKLLRGRGWGEVQFDGTLDKTKWNSFVQRMWKENILTKSDYDFLQKVWDLLDSMKPDAQRAHKEMYGFYFNEVTANEFETPFGKYKGGYVPAKVDLLSVEDQAIRQEMEAMEQNDNTWAFPTTGRGFTKSRVQQYAAPLSLDISLLGGHIDHVLRFTYINPRVAEVGRIMFDKGFREQLAQVDEKAASEMFVPWLQRTAQQKVVTPAANGIGKALDSVARYLRTSVAMQIMFGNLANSMQQFTGAIVAMSKVDPRFIGSAMHRYTTDHKKVTQMIIEKSPFMDTLQGQSIYDTTQAIHQILVDPNWYDKSKDWAVKHTYFLQSATQNIVNSVVWMGAYEQGIEKGMSDKEAVLAADSAVRLTQGTTNPEDISRFETGTATARLFTQFTGYFNMLANLNYAEIQKIQRSIGLKKGAGKAFYVVLMSFSLPAILSQAVLYPLRGKGFDEDDDGYLDDILDCLFGSQFRTMIAMIPYAGTTINAVINNFNDNPMDDRLNLSPVVLKIEQSTKVPSEVYKNLADDMDNDKAVVRDVLNLIGIITKLPTGPLSKPAGYMLDVSEGRAQPTGPIDYTRGLITGAPGSP